MKATNNHITDMRSGMNNHISYMHVKLGDTSYKKYKQEEELIYLSSKISAYEYHMDKMIISETQQDRYEMLNQCFSFICSPYFGLTGADTCVGLTETLHVGYTHHNFIYFHTRFYQENLKNDSLNSFPSKGFPLFF